MDSSIETQPWTTYKVSTSTQAHGDRGTVAIFADYDGCWDIISPTNPMVANNGAWLKQQGVDYDFVAGILKAAIADITKGKRVILFVGSNLQARDADNVNSCRNRNGLALGPDGAFEQWASLNQKIGW